MITDNRIPEDTRDRSIDVYPNPARTYFIVYNYQDANGRIIELFDISGKRVKYTRVTNLATRIETADLSGGLYILKVNDGHGKVLRTEKMIIYR